MKTVTEPMPHLRSFLPDPDAFPPGFKMPMHAVVRQFINEYDPKAPIKVHVPEHGTITFPGDRYWSFEPEPDYEKWCGTAPRSGDWSGKIR